MNRNIIEVKQLRGDCKVVEANPDQVVYIADVVESQVIIKGPCMKVVAIDVHKSMIVIKKATTTVEIARAKSSLFVVGSSPLTSLEQCIECRMGTVESPTEIRMRRCMSISLVYLKGVDTDKETIESLDGLCQSAEEQNLPDEIQTVVENGVAKSNIIKNG
ncbi:hypothetical protein NEIRO03_2460 [Nematocida sp. AWRm78]|nr:hypothetical protein NEIRO02_2139 [Nematocida sp. AWRm79]KAI5187136.1 hypothetical protein NEIRO03_2460 [Nematocida sp. AWRm78]